MQTVDFWKLFKPSACSVRLRGSTQEDVFGEIVANLIRAGCIAADLEKKAMAALRDREVLASTGVGQNVAIPHVKLAGLEEVAVSLSIHPEGVEWKSLDGSRAHLFFTVMRPVNPGATFDPERHLEMMRWISVLGREPDFRNFARASANRTELVALLKEMSGVGT